VVALIESLITSNFENKTVKWGLGPVDGTKKLSSFIHSCLGDVVYDRYETAKIK
jgi:hypothetical protein